MHAPSKFVAASAAGLLLAMQTSALTVNSPASLTTCQPIRLGWGDGTAPYYVSVIPGGDPSGAPLKQFAATNAESYTWVVDLPAGTSVTIAVTDGTGEVNYSSQVTISEGTDTSCIGASSAAGGAVAGSSDAAIGASSAPVAAASSTPATTRRLSSTTPAGVSSVPAGNNQAAQTTSASSEDASSGASRLLTSFGSLVAGALLVSAVF